MNGHADRRHPCPATSASVVRHRWKPQLADARVLRHEWLYRCCARSAGAFVTGGAADPPVTNAGGVVRPQTVFAAWSPRSQACDFLAAQCHYEWRHESHVNPCYRCRRVAVLSRLWPKRPSGRRDSRGTCRWCTSSSSRRALKRRMSCPPAAQQRDTTHAEQREASRLGDGCELSDQTDGILAPRSARSLPTAGRSVGPWSAVVFPPPRLLPSARNAMALRPSPPGANENADAGNTCW